MPHKVADADRTSIKILYYATSGAKKLKIKGLINFKQTVFQIRKSSYGELILVPVQEGYLSSTDCTRGVRTSHTLQLHPHSETHIQTLLIVMRENRNRFSSVVTFSVSAQMLFLNFNFNFLSSTNPLLQFSGSCLSRQCIGRKLFIQSEIIR